MSDQPRSSTDGTDGTEPIEPFESQPSSPEAFGKPIELQPSSPEALGQPAPAEQPAAGAPASVPPPPWKKQAAAPEGKRTGGMSLLKRIGGALLVFALIYAGKSLFFGSGIGAPKVGECVKVSSDNTETVVECTSSEAQYKVLGVATGISESEFDADTDGSMCETWPEATYGLWSGNSSNGTVLCLGPVG